MVALYGDTNENIVRRAELIFSLSAQPSTRTEINKATSRIQFAELYYVEGKNLVTQRGVLGAGKTKCEDQVPWNWATDTSLMRGAVLVDVTENPDKPIIRKATLEDLRPAYSFGNEKSSKLFTMEQSCTPYYIVVYNGI